MERKNDIVEYNTIKVNLKFYKILIHFVENMYILLLVLELSDLK